jgi:hypothetical protein
MVPLSDRLCADPSESASPFDLHDQSTPEGAGRHRESQFPSSLGCPPSSCAHWKGLRRPA